MDRGWPQLEGIRSSTCYRHSRHPALQSGRPGTGTELCPAAKCQTAYRFSVTVEPVRLVEVAFSAVAVDADLSCERPLTIDTPAPARWQAPGQPH